MAAIFTVREALTACGVNNIIFWEGKTPAERMAPDLFDDNFAAAMDKEWDELDSDFKTYAELTTNQGQIRLTPGTTKNVKAFIQ